MWEGLLGIDARAGHRIPFQFSIIKPQLSIGVGKPGRPFGSRCAFGCLLWLGQIGHRLGCLVPTSSHWKSKLGFFAAKASYFYRQGAFDISAQFAKVRAGRFSDTIRVKKRVA